MTPGTGRERLDKLTTRTKPDRIKHCMPQHRRPLRMKSAAMDHTDDAYASLNLEPDKPLERTGGLRLPHAMEIQLRIRLRVASLKVAQAPRTQSFPIPFNPVGLQSQVEPCPKLATRFRIVPGRPSVMTLPIMIGPRNSANFAFGALRSIRKRLDPLEGPRERGAIVVIRATDVTAFLSILCQTSPHCDRNSAWRGPQRG